jgi:DNA-binding transcriptional regulator YiaG
MKVASQDACASKPSHKFREKQLAKTAKKKKTAKTRKSVRREYTKADVKELRAHSRLRTPVANIAKLTKRTEGSLRQKAVKLGIKLGHRR